MSSTSQLAFQVFALEVSRHAPDLFEHAMDKASLHLEAARKVMPADAFQSEKEVIREIYRLSGLMKLLNKDDPEDVRDVDTTGFVN